MKVLVINAGSSSLKYQLIDMEDESVIAKGNCERIGDEVGLITHKPADGRVYEEECIFADHAAAFKKLVQVLTTGDYAVVKSLDEISAVGHRIVQGADIFSESVIVTDKVIDQIQELSPLAPVHNSRHAQALRACKKVFGDDVPEVVVFDTAFHQTMPPKAYMFGMPYEYYEKYHVRKYGFHGTSHRFVSARLAKLMGKDIKDLRIITCHLGNGSSISAVDHGKCVDTTMGFTPLDGLLMGTRSGAVDPSAIIHVMKEENLSAEDMNNILNKKSGYLGVSGVTSDDRDLRKAAQEGNKRAQLASDMQRYQVKKYIGSFAAAMGGVDAVVFTGGIGEHSIELRSEVCANMEFLGIKIDENLNEKFNGEEKDISAEGATVRTWIVPTNEELMIARDTVDLITK